MRGRYVLDKVLHDYPLAQSILRSRHTVSILLLRRPLPTVQSIVNMGLHYSDVAWYRDLDCVARYYEERLGSLVSLAGQLRGRVLFLEAEALLSRTADALRRTATMLELNEPLQADYRRFAHTGESGFGDPSEAISTGRVSNAVRRPRTPVVLPAGLAARLEAVYDICSASLRERCDGSSRSS